MNSPVLPWQQPQWQRVCEQVATNKMPHALLISGPPESGKSLFASCIARYLLCRGAAKPCGACNQCLLLSAGTHPDLLEVTLEESRQIRVEQIRELIQWANQTSQQGGYKVCIISPADKLNVQSSNALLKVLEEPPANTLICLVTDQPARLLPTLRSRCQRIDCHLPSRQEAIAWLEGQVSATDDIELLLEIAGGVPLRVVNSISPEYLELRRELALQLVPLSAGVRSPIELAGILVKEDPIAVLDILYQLIADSIVFSMSGDNTIKNRDLKDQLEKYSNHVSLADRYALLDRIGEAKRYLSGTSNANAQMLLEWVLASAA